MRIISISTMTTTIENTVSCSNDSQTETGKPYCRFVVGLVLQGSRVGFGAPGFRNPEP